MDELALLVACFFFAALRYLPVVAIPALSPFGSAPALVRLTLLFALAWLTVLAGSPVPFSVGSNGPPSLLLACASELLIGLTLGLAILLPQAAIGMSARLADTQAGLSAASLFNPGGQHEPESLFGTVVLLGAGVLFFTLDLHVLLFRVLASSVLAMPLGGIGLHLDMDAWLAMVGRSFVLGLAVVAPVILGLFMLDIGIAYATRSMPQANVYFLALPLKVAVALLHLALTLAFAPALVGRLYFDTLSRVPAVFGA